MQGQVLVYIIYRSELQMNITVLSFLFQDDVEVVYEKLNERVQDLR